MSIFENFLSISLIGIIITVTINFTLIPLIINFGSRFKILDLPNQRKQHKVPLVRLGGISIAAASLTTFYFLNEFALSKYIYVAESNSSKIINKIRLYII